MGHWKSACPIFKAKKSHAGSGRMKPVAMAASVSSLRVLQGECVSSGVTNNIDYSFLPFIREGVVSSLCQYLAVSYRVNRGLIHH